MGVGWSYYALILFVHILYNGAKEPIEAIGRQYNNQLEVDLNKIKKLSLQ